MPRQIHAPGDAVAVAHSAVSGRARAGVPASPTGRSAARRRTADAPACAYQTTRAAAARAGQPERRLPLRQPLCAGQR